MRISIGRILFVAAVALLPAWPGLAPGARAQLGNYLPFGRTQRLAKLLPSVVNITMIKLVHDGDDDSPPRRAENFGSGFIVDPSGIIATNKHVVAGMVEFTVTLQSGASYKARVLGIAGNMDLALLKIDSDKPLPAIKWGDSDRLHIGDQVFAVGNPLGIGESVSEGIVSGLNRNIHLSPFDAFIQTDAAINHGNSGGPLVDMNGEVVGVDTAIYSPGDTGSIGIGFAIPANDAVYIIDQLRRFGRVKLGWLGLTTQELTSDMADSVGLAKPRGVIVAAVLKDTPAEQAGVREGDIVLSFAGQTPKDARALARMVSRARIGVAVPLVIWRDGRELVLPATPTEWVDEAPAPESKPKPVATVGSTDPEKLGLQLSLITDAARETYKIAAEQPGVLVAGVLPHSIAADLALLPGDVILKVQEDTVSSPEEVAQRLQEVSRLNRRHALVLVRRRDEQQWRTLPIGGPN
jgi:serine protease Do